MKVLLLAGGDSSERDVSMESGKAIYEALKANGHEVLAIDPSDGRNLLGPEGKFLEVKCSAEPPAKGVTGPTDMPALAKELRAPALRDVDVVFIGLHGGTGEDGTIQALLSLAGKKFTGSGMRASAIAMHKITAKRLMQAVGVKTPDWEIYRVNSTTALEPLAEKIAARFDLPVIVKPNYGGSTVGLTKVDTPAELTAALRCATVEDEEVLVEAYIQGRELTVALLDGHAYPVVEIIPKSGLYDYEAKYTKGKTEYVAPAEIPDTLSEQIKAAAVTVYNVIGAEGLARVDFMLDEEGEFHCLELNTLPGMTGLSLSPMAAKCEGIDFNQLVEKVLQSALNDPVKDKQ